jgi:hypothetical protein
MKNQRITLICRDSHTPDRDWNLSKGASSRIILTEQVNVMRYAVGETAAEMGVDVERIILDRVSCADNYLQLLSELPHYFTGDALYLKTDGSGFLSATGRGGDRRIYQLSATDIRFYLETAGIVTGSTFSRPMAAHHAQAAHSIAA